MTKQLRAFLIIFPTFFVLIGCKRTATTSQTAYILDENDMEVISFDNADHKFHEALIKSSVLLRTEINRKTTRLCSGVLVNYRGKTQVLTNHHCFAVKGNNDLATEQLVPSACKNTTVIYDAVAGRLKNISTSKCVVGTLRTDFIGDIASFSLDKSVPEGYEPLTIKEGEVSANTPAIIIHYPTKGARHEQVPRAAEPKYLVGEKLPVATITSNNCMILGRYTHGVARQLPVLAVSYRHTCDLVHGSSGSPLIDPTDGTLVGINWGGVKLNTKTGDSYVNAATTSGYVVGFLNGRGGTSGVSDALASLSQKEQKEREKKEAAGSVPQCGSLGVSLADKISHYSYLFIFLLSLLPFLANTFSALSHRYFYATKR